MILDMTMYHILDVVVKMFKVFRCKKSKKVKFYVDNKFGFGTCFDLVQLKNGLKYIGGDGNSRSKYIDRKTLILNRKEQK